MPLVHPCARPGCTTLTMGEFCVEHELHEAALSWRDLRGRLGRMPPRLSRAAVVGLAAAAAALAASRLPR